MPLEQLSPGTSSWQDVKHAALIQMKATHIPDITTLQNDLRNHYMNSASTVIDIHTGFSQSYSSTQLRDDRYCLSSIGG